MNWVNYYGHKMIIPPSNNGKKVLKWILAYSKNYYNACKYYYFTTDKVWSILYGEIFVNMEPLSTHSPEIKNILLESYKKLFADADLKKEYQR